MTATPTANTTANHRLELVGGEWEDHSQSNHIVRSVDGYCMHVFLEFPHEDQWCFQILGRGYPRLIPTGGFRTREAAIAAAEEALLEEIAKFVRVKE